MISNIRIHFHIITRIHSSRMCTDRDSDHLWGGGVSLGRQPPRTDTCPRADTPFYTTPLSIPHPLSIPLPHPMNRMTDTCKNITFPHTSYAVRNNYPFLVRLLQQGRGDVREGFYRRKCGRNYRGGKLEENH